ncbi:MAG: heme ABC exporter ATP-binding protein CcmA [Rhizomicrobium sp.]
MGSLSELQVQDVALVRGERVVQRGLDFRAAAGCSLAIGGRNGAGKTSLLRAIAGLLEPASGSIVVRLNDGRTIVSADERGSFVGWVGHQNAIKPQLTPAEHLEFHARYFRRDDRIDEALERSGLADLRDVPAQYLSAGQQRRIAFARLILMGRPLWLLDEPFSALDLHGRALVRDLVANHCAGGGVVLAATHEPIGTGTPSIELA